MDTSPKTQPSTPTRVETTKGRRFAILGTTLFTGPIWGAAGTAIGMRRSFGTLAQNATASPQDLAKDIELALISTLVGIFIGVIGAMLILIALFTQKNREKWFLHSAIFLSVIWCILLYPLGLIVGLPVALCFLKQRREFRTAIRP